MIWARCINDSRPFTEKPAVQGQPFSTLKPPRLFQTIHDPDDDEIGRILPPR